MASSCSDSAPMIYGLNRDEQQGWMSRGAPDCIFSQSDPYLQHILSSLGNSNSLSQEQIKWLYHWCGAYECIRTFNEAQLKAKNSLFGARVAFLQRSWQNQHFRPFDTMDSAVEFLKNNMSCTNAARLSTTRPGFITLTTRNSENFTHTRYQVLQNSTIVDSDGKQHSSISSLASKVART